MLVLELLLFPFSGSLFMFYMLIDFCQYAAYIVYTNDYLALNIEQTTRQYLYPFTLSNLFPNPFDYILKDSLFDQ